MRHGVGKLGGVNSAQLPPKKSAKPTKWVGINAVAHSGWTNQLYGQNTLWVPYYAPYNTSFPVPTVGKTISDGTTSKVITSITNNNSAYGMTYILYFTGNAPGYATATGFTIS